MLKTEKLRDAIQASGISIVYLANKLGLTREGLYNKINGLTEFKASEIINISDVLHLNVSQRDSIFFDNSNEFNSTRERR